MTKFDCRLFSLVFLSLAVLQHFGEFTSVALSCLFLALLFGLLSLSAKPWGPPLPRLTGILPAVALGATSLLYNGQLEHPVFTVTFAMVVVAILVHTLFASRVATMMAFVLAAGAAMVGIITNLTWGFVNMDVFQFQQSASQALLHGQNPYTPVVPSRNILPSGIPESIPLHFPYGPVLPVLEAPFRLLGDVRVLHVLAATVLSAVVLLLARRAGTFDRSACMVMAFPLTVGMVLFSWVDVITMASLAVWFVFFRTNPRIATFALVIALAAKPTTLIALVPIVFWSVRGRRQVVIAAVLAAIFVLPFALITGLSQFYYNVLGIQLAVLTRLDALTINSYLNSLGLPILPAVVSALVIGAAAVLVLRRRPRTYGDLFTATAILATVSFLVAKWAYFNYYYIPAVLLMLAIAGDSLPFDVPEMIRPPALVTAAGDGLRAAIGRIPGAHRLPGGVLSPGDL